MNIDILFEDLQISKWDDEPIELVVLTADELGLPEFPIDDYQPGDGMPIAYNGFPPSEWL